MPPATRSAVPNPGSGWPCLGCPERVNRPSRPPSPRAHAPATGPARGLLDTLAPMRRWVAAACLVSGVLVGAAPAGLSRDLRERFIAGVAAHKAGDWTTSAKEFSDPEWAGTPLEDYALLFLAESRLRLGDAAAARALLTQAVDRTPESALTAGAMLRASGVLVEAGDPAAA